MEYKQVQKDIKHFRKTYKHIPGVFDGFSSLGISSVPLAPVFVVSDERSASSNSIAPEKHLF